MKYNKVNERLSRLCKIVRYGRYEEIEEDNVIKTKVIKSIPVDSFYKLYLELNNVIEYRRKENEVINIKLSNTQIELLVHLMMKDNDFTIVFRNKDATLVKLGEELGKTVSSIYATLSKLRSTGYVMKDEDNLLVLNKELTDLIKSVSISKDKGEPLKFDYLFKCCVEDKDA